MIVCLGVKLDEEGHRFLIILFPFEISVQVRRIYFEFISYYFYILDIATNQNTYLLQEQKEVKCQASVILLIPDTNIVRFIHLKMECLLSFTH